MTIGSLARRAGVNPRTLRYYERIGMLAPSARSEAGYRLYTDRDAGAAPCRHVRALAQAKAAEIDTRIADLLALRQELVALADRALAVEPACAAATAAICLAFDDGSPAAP